MYWQNGARFKCQVLSFALVARIHGKQGRMSITGLCTMELYPVIYDCAAFELAKTCRCRLSGNKEYTHRGRSRAVGGGGTYDGWELEPFDRMFQIS